MAHEDKSPEEVDIVFRVEKKYWARVQAQQFLKITTGKDTRDRQWDLSILFFFFFLQKDFMPDIRHLKGEEREIILCGVL